MQRIRFRAMGCQMAAVIAADTPEAAEALRNVPVWFEIWEQCLSRFRPNSELSRLNARSGEWVQVSETLWAVLDAALQAAQFTDGQVTPTIHDAMLRIGYGQSFERIVGAGAHLQFALPAAEPAADWRRIERRAAERAVRLPRGTHLDLGGVAKGWCAAQAARRLATLAPALVDAGGDICVAPAGEQRTAFPIGIADPLQPDALLADVTLEAGCVATSGRDYRRWHVGDAPVHHLIAPHTGAPAHTDVLTATVIAPDAVRAEAAAKAAVLMGTTRALAWLDPQPDLAALLVREDGAVMHTHSFARFSLADQPQGDVR